MRPVRKISSRFTVRTVEVSKTENKWFMQRPPVEIEPVGTLLLVPFKITGYAKDSDGSLIAQLTHVDKAAHKTGWIFNNTILGPDNDLVVSKKELKKMFEMV